MIRCIYAPELRSLSSAEALLHDQVTEFCTCHAQRSTAQAYQTVAGFINAPFDERLMNEVMRIAQTKKLQADDVVVVVGIGGSGLGTQAVYQALRQTLPASPQVIFADTPDPALVTQACRAIEHALSSGKRVIVVLNSKTGTTLETIAYGEIVLALLKKYRPTQWRDEVMVTTDERSPLAQWAREHDCICLALPAIFEGRFTIFSAIGLLPLALLGVDINLFCAGAQQSARDLCGDWLDHEAVRGAYATYDQYLQGNFLLDFFTFAEPLLGLGAWYRQLIGEGLGKPYQVGNMPSLVPLVTRGSNDLHSMIQVYLGGNLPLYTQFVTVERCLADVHVPFQTSLPGAQRYAGKTANQLLTVLFESTRRAYAAQGKPYVHISFEELTAAHVGYFLQTYMMQMVMLARLFGVNPYTQPHVELYKKEARALLGG